MEKKLVLNLLNNWLRIFEDKMTKPQYKNLKSIVKWIVRKSTTILTKLNNENITSKKYREKISNHLWKMNIIECIEEKDKSKTEKTLEVVDKAYQLLWDKKWTLIIDRWSDSAELIDELLQRDINFIIRAKSNRKLIDWKTKKYKKQTSDVLKTWARIPLFHYDDFEDFRKNLPYDCQLVGVELDEKAVPLHEFKHPKRAVYLLGAEDNGLPPKVLEECHHLVQLPGTNSLNVAVTGSIVLNDRVVKIPTKLP